MLPILGRVRRMPTGQQSTPGFGEISQNRPGCATFTALANVKTDADGRHTADSDSVAAHLLAIGARTFLSAVVVSSLVGGCAASGRRAAKGEDAVIGQAPPALANSYRRSTKILVDAHSGRYTGDYSARWAAPQIESHVAADLRAGLFSNVVQQSEQLRCQVRVIGGNVDSWGRATADVEISLYDVRGRRLKYYTATGTASNPVNVIRAMLSAARDAVKTASYDMERDVCEVESAVDTLGGGGQVGGPQAASTVDSPPSPLPLSDVEELPAASGVMLDAAVCAIFGVEVYRYAPKASFAANDAATFKAYAQKFLGVPERNIHFRANADATKGEFDKVFGEDGWLKRRVTPSSDVIVFYSGHGSADVSTGRRYLIPYDIDPNYAGTGVSVNRLLDFLARLNAKSVTVFLDACFSGVGRQGEMLLADARPLVAVEVAKASDRLNFLSSSTGTEISSGYAEKKHGLFTYYLLKGLGGEADLNQDKTTTFSELSQYVRDRVSTKARDLDREQTPESSGPDRVLVRLK